MDEAAMELWPKFFSQVYLFMFTWIAPTPKRHRLQTPSMHPIPDPQQPTSRTKYKEYPEKYLAVMTVVYHSSNQLPNKKQQG